MKKLFLFLLFPLSSFAQITDTNLNLEADTIRLETHAGRNTAQRVGRMFKNIIASKSNINGNTGVLAIAGGGTGTATPGLIAGTNISITGTWPNQTINQSGGSGISNSAASNELMKSNGTDAVASGIFSSNSGEINSVKSGGGAFNAMPGLSAVNMEAEIANNSGNSMDVPFRVSHFTSTGYGVGVGTAIDFASTTANGVAKIGGEIGIIATNVGSGTESFDYVIKTMSAGAAVSEKFRIKSTGSLSMTNLSLSNGWTNGSVTTSAVRLRPDDVLDVSLFLNANTATNAVFATVTGLTFPSSINSGVINFIGVDYSGNHIYVRANFSGGNTITFDCPGYASIAGLQITGSVPLITAIH